MSLKILLLLLISIRSSSAIVWVSLFILGSCKQTFPKFSDTSEQPFLGVIAMEYGANAQFEQEFFTSFARQKNIKVDLVPPTETVKSRLGMYQQLFSRRAAHPDLFEIDVVWPAILADKLIDLTPYFQKELKEFDPQVLRGFTIRGRLVALPTFIDMGVLYYRIDLLQKYNFKNPPQTWDELEHMAAVIQAGERRKGNRDFWGYVFQGGAYEALTCNAMEWQASAGSPSFLDSQGSVHVNNPQMIAALKRAVAWIGKISPPGEPYYREMDALNLWSEGNAVFMRGWVSSYSQATLSSPKEGRFRVASLPGGPGGWRSTLGGLGMGVSKYSSNPKLAVEALRGITSEQGEQRRAVLANTIPTRIALRNKAEIMANTALSGREAEKVMRGLISRPALVSGESYASVSRAYFKAVNSVLTRQTSAEEAMAKLETQLLSMKGFRASQ